MRPTTLFGLAIAACLPLAGVASANDADDAKTAPAVEEATHVGYELGSFVLRDYQPLQDTTLRLIFTAHASVTRENAKGFAQVLASRTHRVRDQIITAARLASPEEFEDPQLTLLRRRIHLRLRHAMPELAIDEIYLTEFQLYKD